MSMRFRGLLLVGGLVVIACLQGCASNASTGKSASAKAARGKGAVVAAQAVAKPAQGPAGVEPAPVESASVPAETAKSPSPPVAATAEQNRLEPVPRAVPPREVTPAPAAKPESRPMPKPVAQEKPVLQEEPKPAAKPAETVAPKPVAQPKPVPIAEPAGKPKPPTASAPKPAPLPQAAPAKSVEVPPPVIPAQAGIPKPVSGAELSPEIVEVMEPDVEVTLESLPITIGGEWVLFAGGDTCSLSSLPVRFDDGQGMSKLQLVFTSQHWLIKTQSDIDMSYSGTGLTVDEVKQFPLEQLVRDSDLMFTKEYAAMTQAFITGERLRITLGFWPTWPVTETKNIQVSLQHFARAHRAWKQCLSLINGR